MKIYTVIINASHHNAYSSQVIYRKKISNNMKVVILQKINTELNKCEIK